MKKQLCHLSLFLCLSCISLGGYCQEIVVKSRGFEKKIKRGDGYIGRLPNEGGSNLLLTTFVCFFSSIGQIFSKKFENSSLQTAHSIWLPFTIESWLMIQKLKLILPYFLIYCILQTQVEFAIFTYLQHLKKQNIQFNTISQK